MWQCGRVVPDRNVGARPPAVANRIEEVGTVLAGVEVPLGLFAEHILRTIELPSLMHVDGQVALVAVEGAAVLAVGLPPVGRPKPLFVDDQPLGARDAVSRVLKRYVVRVGILLVVVEIQLLAESGDARGMRLDVQAPQGDIQLVPASPLPKLNHQCQL